MSRCTARLDLLCSHAFARTLNNRFEPSPDSMIAAHHRRRQQSRFLPSLRDLLSRCSQASRQQRTPANRSRIYFTEMFFCASLDKTERAPKNPFRRRFIKLGLRLFVCMWFQDLFHSPPGVLFAFPSRYWFTIGRLRVFSLGGWSPHIQTGCHVSRPTCRTPSSTKVIFHTGLSPAMAGLSIPF